jgi:hypothetical protein
MNNRECCLEWFRASWHDYKEAEFYGEAEVAARRREEAEGAHKHCSAAGISRDETTQVTRHFNDLFKIKARWGGR